VTTLDVNPATFSVDDLKKKLAGLKGMSVDRVGVSYFNAKGKKTSFTHGPLEKFELTDGAKINFKDLGPQVDYQMVFIMEYMGPILAYLLVYLRPEWLYGVDTTNTPIQWVQNLACICWMAHYAKREFETLFVHRFSHGTMPLFNLFKNCSYYWGFAAYVAYFVNHPKYTAPSETHVYVGLTIFIICELSNLYCHIILRNLRPAGSKERKIPRGFLFEFVSCPNYTVEILAWLGFNIMTQSIAGYLFMFAGAYQMFIWAAGKHRNYKKQFNGENGNALYPRNRKMIVPFLY
jgi:very-long-chain enoyl-CoA reductase